RLIQRLGDLVRQDGLARPWFALHQQRTLQGDRRVHRDHQVLGRDVGVGAAELHDASDAGALPAGRRMGGTIGPGPRFGKRRAAASRLQAFDSSSERQSRPEGTMPAKSKKQQMAAGAALSAKRGERPKSSLKGASRSMAESMSEEKLSEMASVERKK